MFLFCSIWFVDLLFVIVHYKNYDSSNGQDSQFVIEGLKAVCGHKSDLMVVVTAACGALVACQKCYVCVCLLVLLLLFVAVIETAAADVHCCRCLFPRKKRGN